MARRKKSDPAPIPEETLKDLSEQKKELKKQTEKAAKKANLISLSEYLDQRGIKLPWERALYETHFKKRKIFYQTLSQWDKAVEKL